MNIDDVFAAIVFVFAMMMVVIVVAMSFQGEDIRKELLSKCESKGGTLLDRTYQVGKTTGHNYTCVNPNVIIDMEK